MGWMSDVVDYGDKLFKSVGVNVGAVWDWGTKSPAAMGAIAGIGKGVLSYMGARDAPSASKDQIKYYQERAAAHNRGIAEAAKRYKPKVRAVPKMKPLSKLGG